jgi:iron complex transport system ATP-binding protein
MTLALNNLDVGFGQTPLIRSAQLSLSPGGIHYLLGRNGSGKSTLLRSIMGQVPVLGGDVLFEGQDILGLSEKARGKLVSYQRGRSEMTARLTLSEYLGLALDKRGWLGGLSPVSKIRIDKVMAQLSLLEQSDLLMTELSDGQLQKAMIGLTLLRDTPLVLLDEPLSYLDPPTRREVLSILTELAKSRILFMSTHHLEYTFDSKGLITFINAENKLQVFDKQGASYIGLEAVVYAPEK